MDQDLTQIVLFIVIYSINNHHLCRHLPHPQEEYGIYCFAHICIFVYTFLMCF